MNNINTCIPKLSQKELLSIKDQIHAEKLAISKFQQYAVDIDDPGLKSMCKDMVEVHEKHYNTLVKHLNC